MMENWTEIGFAGLSATILFMTFKWMTSELNKKIDDLQDIVIKLIDAKNTLKEAISDHELKMLDEWVFLRNRNAKIKRPNDVL